MTSLRQNNGAMRLIVGTALAAAFVAGSAGYSQMAFADGYNKQAESGRLPGKMARAINQAEKAVAQSPRDAGARLVLAQAYLDAGRFASAATTFADAQALGDGNPRTALSLALAQVGAGRNSDAIAVLDQWRDSIPASDLGLALALAGDTGRGVAILADAMRNSEASPKLRQNLAYAYALDGRWREARLMAMMDVPADQIDQRISDWAMQASPEDSQRRVASLLGVVMRTDAGQPLELALADRPTAAPALASAVPVTEPDAPTELPAVDGTPGQSFVASEQAAPVATPAFAQAFSGARMVSQPVVQPLPQGAEARPARLRPASASLEVPATASPSSWTHLVQLGSFASLDGAKRAWQIFVGRNPELRRHEMTITEALVRGKKFWRVAAGGFSRNTAASMCSSVKGRGGACIAYAQARPMPGALPARNGAGPMKARRR